MNRFPSFSMRMMNRVLKLLGSDLKPARFARLQTTIHQRAYPQPAPMPPGLLRNLQVQTATHNHQPVFTLTPHRNNRPIHVLYTPGGAYIFAMQSIHWLIAQNIAQTLGATVTLAPYPLAPEHDYRAAYAHLENLYRQIVAQNPNHKIILCGDSAGGGLALGQALHYRALGWQMPTSIALFSPWLDVTLANPQAAALEPEDAALSVVSLRQCGTWWAGTADAHHPLISPLYAELNHLPPVDIFQGSADIFLPDARSLAAQITQIGGNVRLFEYPQAFHDFIAATFTPEARHVFANLGHWIEA
ncbi:MAG: hypothetical protein OHK0052_21040 [Anaerolineales bacterium]